MPDQNPTPGESLLLGRHPTKDPFEADALAKQLEWYRLIFKVTGEAQAALVAGDYNQAAQDFARCERLVVMIQESKRWLRIYKEKGAIPA